MTNEQLKKIRAIVYDAYCEGDTDAEALLPILDAALAAPEQEPTAYMLGDDYFADARCYEPQEGDTPLYRHPSPQSQPVARVTGYYGGRCVIEPLDGKSVFPAGMAVYSAPVAAQAAQPTDCTRIMREQGKPYPRTCPRCKLGPCAYSPAVEVTAPPSREWQGLTDDDIIKAFNSLDRGLNGFLKTWGWLTFAKAIEAALRAKNTGEQA